MNDKARKTSRVNIVTYPKVKYNLERKAQKLGINLSQLLIGSALKHDDKVEISKYEAEKSIGKEI